MSEDDAAASPDLTPPQPTPMVGDDPEFLGHGSRYAFGSALEITEQGYGYII